MLLAVRGGNVEGLVIGLRIQDHEVEFGVIEGGVGLKVFAIDDRFLSGREADERKVGLKVLEKQFLSDALTDFGLNINIGTDVVADFGFGFLFS